MKKSDLEVEFEKQVAALHIPKPVKQFQFAKELGRKWRADFAWPEFHLLVEVEGGVWNGGRHVSPAGYVADLEKYNASQMLGYTLLRYDTTMVKSGKAVAQVADIFTVFNVLHGV